MFRFLRPPLLVAILLSCALVAGCGYRLVNQEGGSPFVGKKIAIPVFANKTYRPLLETVLTERLVDEFGIRSGGVVVPRKDADLIINGTVTGYGTVAVAFDSQDKIKEYRAEMTMEAAIVTKETGRVVWQGKLTDRQDYPVESDISLQMNRESAAIEEICRKLAQRLIVSVNRNF